MARLIATLSRVSRDFAVFWRLAELRGVLACVGIEARTGVNAGDAAVMAVGAFALLFVLAVVSSEQPKLAEQLACSHIQARTKGVRQPMETVQEAPGSAAVEAVRVGQCGPWV